MMKSNIIQLEQSLWLWPGAIHENARNVYADFRHDFTIGHKVGVARLAITADQCYTLYFNGKYIGRGPARGYQWSWPYDEYDLREYCRLGHNWISIRVYNNGGSTFQYLHQSAYGMICAGEIHGQIIMSGPGWVGRISRANRCDTAKLSVQLNHQEWMDARVDDQAWIRSAEYPRGWKTPAVMKPYGHMPWHTLEPRGIPNLSNELLAYRCVVARGKGKCEPQYQSEPNLTLTWHKELACLKLERRIDDAIRDIALPASGADGLQAVVFDMGRPTCGTLNVDVNGARDGEVLDFFFCEALSDNGVPALRNPETGCAVAMSSRLVLRTGRTRHDFFQMMGHRYLTVIARATNGPLNVKVRLRETIYPLEIKGNFFSGNDELNNIYKICRQTQRVCMLDSYVDTPWREQAQWWGDARVQAWNTFHLSGDERLFMRGIRSIARQEAPNGLTYGHAPTCAHNCVLPDFSLTWLLTVWDHYFQTGDLVLFREQYGRIEKLLCYFRGEGRSRNGLLRYDRRYWLFLDWSDLYKGGNPALLNLWYVMALEKLAKLAGLVGWRRAQKELTGEYHDHCRNVIKAFWDGKKEMFCDGLTEKGKRVEQYSIHTQTLAILCGLQAARQKKIFEEILLPYARGNEIPGAKPSSYWVTYVYEVLKRSGYGAEVARHIHRKWTPMIPYGGTWEVFDNKFGAHSVTHAWAAHPLYHLAGTLGGVLQESAGWKEIIFRPVIMPEYKFAETTVPTPQGKIRSAWKVGGDEAEVRLDLPPGISAEVFLPGVRERASGRKKWIIGFG